MTAVILIVEDNDLNLEMLERRLRKASFEVLIARDGLSAIELAGKHHPDLILMDLGLPGLDGWEATRRLRAAPDTGDIPVVALTAHAMPGDRERALAAGCQEFMSKPVVWRDLHAMILRLLGLPS